MLFQANGVSFFSGFACCSPEIYLEPSFGTWWFHTSWRELSPRHSCTVGLSRSLIDHDCDKEQCLICASHRRNVNAAACQQRSVLLIITVAVGKLVQWLRSHAVIAYLQATASHMSLCFIWLLFIVRKLGFPTYNVPLTLDSVYTSIDSSGRT